MSLQLDVPHLDLPEAEAQRRFVKLQEKLIPLWETIDDLDLCLSHLDDSPQAAALGKEARALLDGRRDPGLRIDAKR